MMLAQLTPVALLLQFIVKMIIEYFIYIGIAFTNYEPSSPKW